MAPTAPRTAVKLQPWTRDATSRRTQRLQQQRQARRDLTDHARQLMMDDPPPPSATPSASETEEEDSMMQVTTPSSSKKQTREERVKHRRQHFANQLMVPEWLVDIPSDLNGKGSAMGEGWYVLPRPEGKRCLVIAHSGITIARIQSGSVLKKFPSALPCGSRKTMGPTDSSCILDCFFQEHDNTFYVLDVMSWKGYMLYNCTTEFRLYWLRDKLSEGSTTKVSSANPYRFVPIPCFESDPKGIQDAYSTPFPFLKDGLLFYLKAAHYDMGLSSLALVWKDAHTSRYFVYTDQPSIVLQLGAGGVFTTLEGIALYQVDGSCLHQHELSEGDLAKFSFEHGYMAHDETPCLTGLTFAKRCSPQRALADSWTKILFQYNARSGGIQIQHLLEAASKSILPSGDAVVEATME